jgi:maltokinase
VSDPRPTDLSRARWFPGKSRRLTGVVARDSVPLGGDLRLALHEVHFAAGPSEVYAVPNDDGPAFGRAIFAAIERGEPLATSKGGLLRFGRAAAFERVDLAEVEPLGVEQSNTSLRLGRRFVLKLFRRLWPGENPELEVGRFLTEHTSFHDLAALAGWVEYRGPDGGETTIAVLQAYVPCVADGWTYALGRLGAPELLGEIADLGRTTRALHDALSGDAARALPAFAPEPFSAGDLGRLVASATAGLEVRAVPPELRDRAARALEALATEATAPAVKTRVHGDYHLGQVLRRETGGFAVVDFEGEPARPLAERRAKHPPEKDVSGMLRSLDYAVAVAKAPADLRARARERFLEAYGPVDARLLRVLEIDKAIYEVRYEADHRPDWVAIALGGLERLVS